MGRNTRLREKQLFLLPVPAKAQDYYSIQNRNDIQMVLLIQVMRLGNIYMTPPVQAWVGIIPELFDRKRYNEDGVGGMHVYTPWWLDNKKLDFPRGYHIEYGGGFGMPLYGFQWGVENLNGRYTVKGKQKQPGGYGAVIKRGL